MGKALRLAAVSVVMGLAASGAMGQSFSLDDNGYSTATDQFFYLWLPNGPYGNGAEAPFGLLGDTLAAKSPSLDALQQSYPAAQDYRSQDGTIMTPLRGMGANTETQFFNAGASQVHAFSVNKADSYRQQILLSFSVDRLTGGSGAVGVAAAEQTQPGDIFRSSASFKDPSLFAPLGGTNAYSGPVAAYQTGVKSNYLLKGYSELGLLVASNGRFDNVDALDFEEPAFQEIHMGQGQTEWASVYNKWSYFSTQPQEITAVNTILTPAVVVERDTQGNLLSKPPQVSAADIFAIKAGTCGLSADQSVDMEVTYGIPSVGSVTEPLRFPVAFARAGTMGLDGGGVNTDCIDGLVLFDNGTEGVLEPGTDYALFSLAPGSDALTRYLVAGAGSRSLSAADIFFTDFMGRFALYASASDLGVDPSGNIDALEIPEPGTLSLLLLGGAAALLRKRR